MTKDWVLAIGVAAIVSGPLGADAAGRVDLPVRQIVLPNGDTRYAVPVTVGDGAPMEAELDTGSFGLRVLKGALKPDQFEPTDTRRSFAFSGGAKFEGILARATVGVGGARTDRPILFQVIDAVGCVERRPGCAASKIKAEDYRIAGDGIPGQGFDALLGIAMRRAQTEDSAFNPLAAMGAASWIVVLPRPGSPDPGHLVINPDADDRAGFQTMQLVAQSGAVDGIQGWADGALPGCLVDEDKGKRYCGKTLLDSGAPGFVANSADVSQPSPWKAGTRATFTIATGGTPVSVDFTSGGDWSRRVFLAPLRGGDGGRVSAGTLPFFSYAILYDAKAGTIGFKTRD